ncbi:signal peptidase I [Alteromonas sediminis]|uniref:Signal peptidase I n=1 Tax=Alteromonas sediminis TaxID=2259342 RepID=A0A3N5XZ36_9ALTE|nr:signal peptidase I [Alteromonas sediminis]RPJ66292.1 signal peptidase I [Alteromonas sediminis]
MKQQQSPWLRRIWKENKGFIVFIVLMVFFRSAIADWNDVPTGSMKPTILEGDRIWVDKLAYDVKVPFTEINLNPHSEPARGDIIVFESEKAEKRLVKRVIGVPGDQVSMHNNILIINGKALDYVFEGERVGYQEFAEDLLGVTHSVRVSKETSVLQSFAPVIVPEDHYLALGDNRDNSADSRVIGFVPRHEIIGRADYVMFSLNYENYYLPRPEKVFARL